MTSGSNLLPATGDCLVFGLLNLCDQPYISMYIHTNTLCVDVMYFSLILIFFPVSCLTSFCAVTADGNYKVF